MKESEVCQEYSRLVGKNILERLKAKLGYKTAPRSENLTELSSISSGNA